MAASLRDLEEQLAQLTDAEKAQLMMKLLPALSHAFAGIEKRPGVCGGDACIVRARVPAWTLERYRRLGWTEAQILRGPRRRDPLTLSILRDAFERAVTDRATGPQGNAP